MNSGEFILGSSEVQLGVQVAEPSSFIAERRNSGKVSSETVLKINVSVFTFLLRK